jgi:shikimate dehydrogenase
MTNPTACVIGWPVKHSRSPVIHRYWLRELGLPGDYILKPVPPDEIAGFLRDFADSGFVGGNVTVPHKEAAFAAVAERDAAAEAIGAVNTLWMDGGKLLGSNTDAFGFLGNLDESAKAWDNAPGPAVVLGAGGAARAVVWALLSRGFAPIHVVNRTPARARGIAARLGTQVNPATWQALPGLLPEARILVNTTNLGLAGEPDLKVDLGPMRPGSVVADIVYVPLETTLLATARRRDLIAVGGLGMLLHQAVPGFEKWFGKRPEVTPELRAAVLASIEKS